MALKWWWSWGVKQNKKRSNRREGERNEWEYCIFQLLNFSRKYFICRVCGNWWLLFGHVLCSSHVTSVGLIIGWLGWTWLISKFMVDLVSSRIGFHLKMQTQKLKSTNFMDFKAGMETDNFFFPLIVFLVSFCECKGRHTCSHTHRLTWVNPCFSPPSSLLHLGNYSKLSSFHKMN